MENLKVLTSSITWERTKRRNGRVLKYENQILRHKDHISISKVLYVDGKIKHSDLAHIPIELIDSIKELKECV